MQESRITTFISLPSLKFIFPSDNTGNNSGLNILFTVISGAFHLLLSECGGGGMLVSVLALCVQSAIISSIPSECKAAPLRDLIWHRRRRLWPRAQRRWIPELLRACSFSRWEFDLPLRREEKKALHRERGPVLIGLNAKDNLRTEPAGS